MAYKIDITLTTENAAFDDDPAGQTAEALTQFARLLKAQGFGAKTTPLFDVNGNSVGIARVTEMGADK